MHVLKNIIQRGLPGFPPAVAARLTQQVLWLIWACFFLFLFCGFTVPSDELVDPSWYYRVSNLLTYVCVLALIWMVKARAHQLLRICSCINPVFRWLPTTLGMIGLGLMTGYVFAEDFWHSLGWEFVPMLAIVLLLLTPFFLLERERVMKMFAIQSMLGGVLAFYVVYKYPVLEGRGEISSPHYYAFGLSIFSTFTVAYMRHYSRWYQIAALIGYLGYSYLTLAYQSRGGSVIVFLVFPTVFLITQFREGIGGVINGRIVLGLTLILLLGAYWVRQPAAQAQLLAGYEGTLSRLFDAEVSTSRASGLSESVEDELKNARGAESREFLSKATPITWVVGHGWGGGWHSELMKGGEIWSMVHFGPLNLVLKGGLGLAVLFHIFMFSGLFRTWRYVGRDPLASPAFCFLVCYYVGFIKHGPIGNAYNSYVTWIVLGFALCCRDTRGPVPALHGSRPVGQVRHGSNFRPLPAR